MDHDKDREQVRAYLEDLDRQDREMIEDFDRQSREMIQSILKNSPPGSTLYFLYLWDRALGDDDDDAITARWEIAQLYCSHYKVFPAPEERIYLEGLFFKKLNLFSEELREKYRDRETAWHEDLTIPEIEIILKDNKLDNIPVSPLDGVIKHTRKLLRPAIRSDILDTTRPYGTREGKYFEDSEGRTSPVIDPTTESGMKAKSRAYKYRFYPNVEKAFNPVREIISDKLTLLGFDTDGMGNERLAYLSAEISKLKDHEIALLYTFMERDSLENYAQECGKSISALYKQRERLRKKIERNVQNALSQPDV